MAEHAGEADVEILAGRWALAGPARRVAAGYAVIACLWIWLSDRAVALLPNPTQCQSYKGWLFVVVTALLLYIERRRSDLARAGLEDRLRHAARMEAVGQLAGGVAHDFNNFLTTIMGHCDFLASDDQPAAEHSESVSAIRSAARSAGDLTRSLLAVARRQVLASEVVDLNTEARAGLSLVRRSLPETIQVSFTAAPAAVPVKVDRVQLQQVLLNLVANARDAMPEGGALDVTVSLLELATPWRERLLQSGSWAVLRVADTGMGMDEATRLRIFEPFYTTKEPGHGTGLGLATTFGIVRQSGGRIFVESEHGSGSVFEVFLPLADAADLGPLHVQPPAVVRPGQTILVVDDDPAVIRLITRILERGGYQVLPAEDGESALALWHEHRDAIALVVTDVVMPKLGGVPLAEAMRAEQPDVKVLYCSGHAESPNLRRSVAEVGGSFLAKPFTPAELTQVVQDLLGT